MSKKTLFHLVHVLDVGGTEGMLLRLLPHLEQRFNNVVICLRKEGEIGKKLNAADIKVYSLGYRFFLDWPRTFWRFRQLAKQYKPQILNTYLPIPDLFGRAAGRLCQIPENICHLRSTNKGRYAKVILADFLTTFLVDRYTVNSPAIIDHYRSRFPFPLEKFNLIYNFTNLSDFDPRKTFEIRKIKKRFNIPQSHYVVTCVANFYVNKGHRYLLEAVEMLSKNKRKNLTVLLIGEGVERVHLEEQIAKYELKDNIRFLGQQRDVASLLAATDIFILPTFFEGMSNALIEAMVSGCAVITTEIPENETLVTNQKTGILVQVQNTWQIAEAIEFFMKHPPKIREFGGKAREKMLKHFNPQKILNQYEKFYA